MLLRNFESFANTFLIVSLILLRRYPDELRMRRTHKRTSSTRTCGSDWKFVFWRATRKRLDDWASRRRPSTTLRVCNIHLHAATSSRCSWHVHCAFMHLKVCGATRFQKNRIWFQVVFVRADDAAILSCSLLFLVCTLKAFSFINRKV